MIEKLMEIIESEPYLNEIKKKCEQMRKIE